MAGGTLSIIESKAPTSLPEWELHLGRIAADFANRRRDYKEAVGQAKLATAVSEARYAQIRTVTVEEQLKIDIVTGKKK